MFDPVVVGSVCCWSVRIVFRIVCCAILVRFGSVLGIVLRLFCRILLVLLGLLLFCGRRRRITRDLVVAVAVVVVGSSIVEVMEVIGMVLVGCLYA